MPSAGLPDQPVIRQSMWVRLLPSGKNQVTPWKDRESSSQKKGWPRRASVPRVRAVRESHDKPPSVRLRGSPGRLKRLRKSGTTCGPVLERACIVL